MVAIYGTNEKGNRLCKECLIYKEESNFYKNPNVKTSPGYKSFALSSYSLYCKWLLNKDIGIVPLDAPEIVLKLERINQKSWKLE